MNQLHVYISLTLEPPSRVIAEHPGGPAVLSGSSPIAASVTVVADTSMLLS